MTRKIGLIFLSIFMTVLFFSTTCCANEKSRGNIGVSTVEPNGNNGEISIYGTERPKGTWNIATKGQYHFEGLANNEDLFTNYNLTGKKSYRIFVTNLHDSKKLTVKLYKKGSSIAFTKFTVAAKTSTYKNFELDSASDLFLVKFCAPCSFSGYVRAN